MRFSLGEEAISTEQSRARARLRMLAVRLDFTLSLYLYERRCLRLGHGPSPTSHHEIAQADVGK